MYCKILLINTLSAVLGSIAIYYFCLSNYRTTSNIFRFFLFSTVFGITNGLLASFILHGGDVINIIKPIILLLVSTLLIFIILKIKIYQALISYLIYTICMGIGNSFVPLIINIYFNEFTTNNMLEETNYMLLVNALSNLIAYIIIIAIKPLREFISKILAQKNTLSVLFITFLVLTANSGMHFYVKIFNLTAYIIISLLSILYCVYIIIICTHLIKQETSRLEIEQQKFYNESLHDTLFNLRRFKHDWNNNLTVINSMLTMNKIEEMKQYLSELINESQNSNTAIYNIKNAGLFGIVSSKQNYARNLDVVLDISVIGEVESIPGVKISELCEIMGILLDNAIEETCHNDRIVRLTIYNNDQYLELSVSNSCHRELDIQKIYEAGYSSKGTDRGMGLPIVRKIIGKYKNILLNSDLVDNTFTQTITIDKFLH